MSYDETPYRLELKQEGDIPHGIVATSKTLKTVLRMMPRVSERIYE